MFVAYILYSHQYGKYYIGQTNDIQRRLTEHNELSEGSYTSKFRPWALACQIIVSNRSKAVRIEKYLKKKPRDFINRVIDEETLRAYIIQKFGS